MTGREDAAAWCDAACAYIRYKPDRGPVREELLGHIEDKTAFYEDGGLDADAAEDASGQLAVTAYSRSLGDTSCGITVWMPDLRAKWVEIRCPNNDGFVIRLDLPEATT